jgi:hypothetical protein
VAATGTDFLPTLDGLYENITHISRNGDHARNEHLMVFGHDLESLSKEKVTVVNGKGRTVETSQYAPVFASLISVHWMAGCIHDVKICVTLVDHVLLSL